jgi:hypothetical protein
VTLGRRGLKHRLFFVIAAVAGVGLCHGSNAASLIPIEDLRRVETAPVPAKYPDPGESLFSATTGNTVAGADQNSTLAPDAFFGTGNIYTDGGGGDTHSVFDVTFVVDQSAVFALTGSISAGGTRPAPNPRVIASLSDSLGGGQALAGAFSVAGLFLPGVEYRLYLEVDDGDAFEFSSGSWNFSLTVAEPASGALWLAVAAAFLVTRPRGSARCSR